MAEQRGRYYEGGVSSVYFWNLEDGFAGVVLLKKCIHSFTKMVRALSSGLTVPLAVSSTNKSTGSWDSIHVFETAERARMSHYKLTSTVILNMINGDGTLGEMDLSGNMTRQIEQDLPVEDDSSHISNIGKVMPYDSALPRQVSESPRR
jgi:capping protein beta